MLVISADGTYVIDDDGTIRTPGSSSVVSGDDAEEAVDPRGRGPGRRPPSGAPAAEHPGGSATAE